MALFHVSPTRLDQRVARLIARHATPTLERPLKLVTWAADGHVLLPFSAAVWLMSRSGNDQQKRAADDLATSMIIAVVLPHIVKHFVDQKRPDRAMVHGPRHGIPHSGHADNAFPSGHAMHLGVLASAASAALPSWAGTAWAMCSALASTRILLLAHWVSDVVTGFAMGVAVERGIRRLLRPRPGARVS